jgi:isoprenylcysteine carboxyl methyltransferase (ICMT) family protein YpbQ
MNILFFGFVAIIIVQRLLELRIAKRNERWALEPSDCTFDLVLMALGILHYIKSSYWSCIRSDPSPSAAQAREVLV